MENAFLKKFTEITEANLSNPDFGVEELALKMGMSYSSLRRRVSNYTGKSANQLIREIRLKKAFDILQNEQVTTAEVAYRTGFNSPNYFNSCFHEYFGYPPGELRRNGGDGHAGIEGREEEEDTQEVKDVKEFNDLNDHKDVPASKEAKGVKGLKELIGKARVRDVLIISIIIIAILAGILLISGIDWHAGQKKSIAVLPVKIPYANSELQRFGDGLQETLLNGLHDLDFLQVRSRISADKYKNPDDPIKEIGKKLDADYIIYLSLFEADDEYQIYITLNDSHIDSDIWSLPARRVKARDFETMREIVDEIIRELKNNFQNTKETGKTALTATEDPADQHVKQGDFYSKPLNFQPDKALASYHEAVRLKPNLAEVYISIANVLNRLYSDIESRSDSMMQECSNCLKYAEMINPGLYQIHEQRAQWLGNQGDFNQALAECSLALRGNPDSPENLFTTAGILMGLGKWTAAKECLLQVIDKDLFSARHFGQLAVIHEHLRDFPRAQDRYKEVRGLHPVDGPALYGLVGISLKSEGDPAKARALLDTLIPTAYPSEMESLRLYYQYAMIDLYEGKYQDALNRLTGWQKVVPPGPPWYCRPRYLVMAELYGLMKKPDLARQYYDSTRVFLVNLQERSVGNRNDPGVWAALGITWAGLGNNTQAKACAEKATELLSMKPDAFLGPYAMEDVASIYARTSRQQDALNILKKLLSEPGPLTTKILELDPRWKSLRNLPEFRELVSQ